MNALAVLNVDELTPDHDREARSIIFRQARQLSKLLDDLLDVSRVTHDKIKLELEPVNLVNLALDVQESIDSQFRKKKQNLILDLPTKPIIVLGDATRIVQAQINLLINASKYTDEGGHIRYSISHEDEHAVIEISDNGEGMTGELLDKVFDLFVQAEQTLARNSGGMGLGLPLVRMIANAHGGQIDATSEGPGQGSRFTLKLPVAKQSTLDQFALDDVPTRPDLNQLVVFACCSWRIMIQPVRCLPTSWRCTASTYAPPIMANRH